MAAEKSTAAGIGDQPRSRLARVCSRAFLALLFVICSAGAIGLLGGHTSTATSAGSGYAMHLSYPGTARPGLDTFWELRVSHQGGFRGPITIAVTGSYYDLFETQGFYPTPMATTRSGSDVYMKFSPPRGDTFVLMYDAYIQPYIEPTHLFANAATVALVDHSHVLDSIKFHTWLFP